jgi:hypothetical protein
MEDVPSIVGSRVATAMLRADDNLEVAAQANGWRLLYIVAVLSAYTPKLIYLAVQCKVLNVLGFIFEHRSESIICRFQDMSYTSHIQLEYGNIFR